MVVNLKNWTFRQLKNQNKNPISIPLHFHSRNSTSDKGYYILTRYSRCILTLKLSKKTPYNWLARPSGNKISSVFFLIRSLEFVFSVPVNLHFQTVYAFCITIIIQKYILRMCIGLFMTGCGLSQSKRPNETLNKYPFFTRENCKRGVSFTRP